MSFSGRAPPGPGPLGELKRSPDALAVAMVGIKEERGKVEGI